MWGREMNIFNPQVTQSSETIKLSVFVESKKLGMKELWFSVPVEYGDYLCKERLDGFLVGMLFPAMQYGEDIHVIGCISEKLLFNLNNYVVPMVLAFSPSCKKIKISAEKTTFSQLGGRSVGSGFSGGIDSFSTIYDRFELEKSHVNRINSLTFLNVGSHGDKDHIEFAARKFRERFRHLKKFTDEIGLDFIPVDSNLHAFHPWGHQKTHTLTSASGALVLQGRFSKYYYASPGIDYGDMLLYAMHYREKDIGAYCEPMLLPLLSTESLDFISDGYSYSRLSKTMRIADYEPVRKYLNVCVSDTEEFNNCSVCPKCCRTIMTLSSIGKLEDFRDVFDIDKYNNEAKLKFVCKQVLTKNTDPFARDNVRTAEVNGVKLPSYAFSLFVCMPWVLGEALKFYLPPSILHRVKRFIRKSGKGFRCKKS
jgi:hypothetical protein